MPEGCAPSGRGSLGDREGPVLELDLELALLARQHDIGGLVKQRPHPPIAAFGDTVDIVDLARLMPPGDQAQIDTDVPGSADARGIVDRSGTEVAIFSAVLTQIAVIFCETSRPTKWDIDESPSGESPATSPRWRHYRWITRRPRLTDVHIRPDMAGAPASHIAIIRTSAAFRCAPGNVLRRI